MESLLKNELRKLLTGRTIRDEEGWLVAIPEGSRLIYHGVTDRTGYRRIREKETMIQAADSTENAFAPVFKALQNIGIPVNMKTQPEALCALCRIFLTKTVILCVLPGQNGLVRVRAYTGQSLLAGISCRRAISKLEKELSIHQES